MLDGWPAEADDSVKLHTIRGKSRLCACAYRNASMCAHVDYSIVVCMCVCMCVLVSAYRSACVLMSL